MKAIVFTLDAIVAFGIVIAIISGLIFFRTEIVSPYLTAQKLHSVSEDILGVLFNSKLEDVVDNKTLLQEYLNDGTLDEEDLDKKTTDVIGALWANQTKKEEGANLLKDILEDFIPNNTGYQILINDDNFYNSSDTGRPAYENASIRISSGRIISGYQKYKPVSGYVARAWATKIKKNTTEVFSISPEGAGSRGGNVEITKNFTVNGTEIINSTIFVSLHRGASDDDIVELSINGIDIKGKLIDIELDYGGTGCGVFQKADVTDEIQTGSNKIFMKFKNPSYNAHVHPGMRIEVTYASNETLRILKNIRKRFYFDNIISRKPPDDCCPWWDWTCWPSSRHCRSGIFAIKPFYIPQDSIIKNVTLHIKAMNITKYDDNDIRIYFNQDPLNITEAPYDNFLLDEYWNLTDNITEGTNLVSIYLNQIDHDTFRGTRNITLYSDFVSDNSSYIDVEYKLSTEKFKYGYINVGLNEYFGGVKSNPKSYIVNFSNAELWETFLHPVQIFSLRVYVDVWNGVITRVFTSPADRAVPSTIFIDPLNFDVSKNNTIELTDTSWGDEFLPETSLEYSVLIPSQVDYGEVFNTSEDAQNDAEERLNNTLGKYISATDIETDIFSMTNVPYMYGPFSFRVNVWV